MEPAPDVVTLENFKDHFPGLADKEYVGHKKRIYSLSWNSIGSKLASGSADNSIRLWNFEGTSLEKSSDLKGHSDAVEKIAWHPEADNVLASASADKSLKIWDTRTLKAVNSEKTTGSNTNLAWNPNGSIVAVGSKEDVISFYDYKTFKLIKHIKTKTGINEFAWDKSGSVLFLTTEQGQIYVINGTKLNNTPLTQLEAHTAACYCIAIDPLDRYFATGGADALVCLWNLHEIACVRTFSNLEFKLSQISFSHDGTFLATASKDEKVGIFNVETGDLVHEIKCKAPAHTVAWNPKKYVVAYSNEDHSKSSDEGIIHLFKLL